MAIDFCFLLTDGEDRKVFNKTEPTMKNKAERKTPMTPLFKKEIKNENKIK